MKPSPQAKAYYNDNDPAAVAALRQLMADGVIASGDVDDRSIKDVTAHDIRGYTQHHFFAGGGGWSVALRLAGWPDQRPIWTASCPCQPLSSAGRRRGARDPRHLWPDLFRILRAARAAGHGPAVLMGEQVSGALGYRWFDGVRANLAQEDYAARVRDIPACAVDAPIERNRLFWIALARTAEFARQGRLRSEKRNGFAAARSTDGMLASTTSVRQQQPAHARTGRSASAQPQDQERRPVGSQAERHDGDSRLAGPNGGSQRRGHRQEGQTQICAEGEVRPQDRQRQGLPLAERGEGAAAGRPDAQRADGGDGGPVALGGTDGARKFQCEGHVADERGRPGDTDARHDMAMSAGERRSLSPDGELATIQKPVGPGPALRNGSWWADAEWIICHDGKARRAKPGIPMLVDGLPGRVAAWRLIGNAINPILAAEVIGAAIDVLPPFVEAEG